MRPPVRPPRLRCGLFPSIYLPHLLVLPATFGLRCFLPSYPYFPALYVVSVRQVRGLPTASSRFHLTMDTLAVQLCASSLPTRTRDFHPLEPAHGGRTKNEGTSLYPRPCFLLFSSVFLQNPANRQDRSVGCVIAYLDAVSFVAGMHDSSVAHVDGHMAVITNDIARLCLGVRYAVSVTTERR